ncbi:TRAP transporter small permease [Solirhodobacter olei]|jgi:TRAP-type C4-dicarboxylate transport system permease small subunit|uniref:TRAP transporter small permease n=1 Tax=Solirhodobacter olei TaxID=2493082 RepID=UPI000FDC8E89|nr:TRAP transporter small permease subunit [Solirhodobacter olei]
MKLIAWLRRRAEDVAVAMLAVTFATFLLQIFARYFLPFPIGWTQELCETLWLWLVFWCGAFCLDDRDHIKFDTLYLASPLKRRRIFAAVAAVAVVGAFLYSSYDTYDFINFYFIQRSAVMEIPLGYVFSIFGVFLVMMVIRYAVRAVAMLLGGDPDAVFPGHDALTEGEETHLP